MPYFPCVVWPQAHLEIVQMTEGNDECVSVHRLCQCSWIMNEFIVDFFVLLLLPPLLLSFSLFAFSLVVIERRFGNSFVGFRFHVCVEIELFGIFVVVSVAEIRHWNGCSGGNELGTQVCGHL